MSLSGWLKKHLAVRLDSHTLGNFLKNAAPVAGVALGGPAGLALAGGLGAAGEAGRGKTKLSELLKAGISNAGLAAGGQAAVGHFAGSAAPSAFTPSSAATAPVPTGGLSLPSVPNLTSVASKGQSLASQVGSKLGSVGEGITKYAPALQLAGNVAGGVLNAGAQSDQTGLQREQFDFQKQQYSDQEKRRQRLAELLAPLLGQQGMRT